MADRRFPTDTRPAPRRLVPRAEAAAAPVPAAAPKPLVHYPDSVAVALPMPLDRTYTYRVPEALTDAAKVGCRVLVPFGKRAVTGMVVGPGEAVPKGITLRPIQDVLDDQPAFTDEMLRLTRWIADYYLCGWGEAIRAALPTGTSVESQLHLYRTDQPAPEDLPKLAGRVLDYLATHEGEAPLSSVRHQLGEVPLALIRRLEAAGLLRVERELSRAKVRVKYEKYLRLADAFRTPEALGALREDLRGAKQIAVVEALAAYAVEGQPLARQADVLARAEASSATVSSLAKKGILSVEEQEVIRTPLGDLSAQLYDPQPPKKLHRAQQAALGHIQEALHAHRFEAFLLHGVTGSGKTEVYIEALKTVVARGQTGIVLVPEIALTPQTVQRFRAHFGDQIAVLHSRMSLGERYDAWRHLRNGRYSIVIGPRSAVLAPLQNLGLIIVDEEHEPSYKQFDPAPRYHARDVAVMRAHMNDAACILGSATPSLESFANAHWGKYTLLEMPVRVPVPGRKAAPLPTVEVIDLTLEQKKHRLNGALSDTLRDAIRERLDRREQVILLQNRRGYAPIIECKNCGWSPMCPDCSVTLTYHKAKRHLRCHYCGRTQRLPRACPKCSAPQLKQLGVGTQRVEEEIAEVFPDARLLRMDLDTTSRKGAHHKLLRQFERHDADLLLGTQMVAKGLDFGNVTLVGVINADMGLLLPDFRAEERTFQLLTQVAGRAGRADKPGQVLLQTRNANHPVLQHALAHDYIRFAETALPERKLFGYPPFGRMVVATFSGPKDVEVFNLARKWTAALRPHLPPAVQALDPVPAFVARVKRQFRYHTIIKAPRRYPSTALHAHLRAAQDAFGTPPKHYRVALDVDAVGLF